MICSVCHSTASPWAIVDGHQFSHCPSCGSIALNIEEIEAFDLGYSTRVYNADYWSTETHAAHERSWGSSLARDAETIYICQRPVQRFLDIGSGDGSLLDAISYHLPSFSSQLMGVELFPPDDHTKHPGYMIGSIDVVQETIDCGVCIEVIEHLTPLMLRNLVRGLAQKAAVNSCFLFNTGTADYVIDEDASYIDPVNRGHIVSYGMQALEMIFSEFGFRVSPLGNRTWAFIAEFQPTESFDLVTRTWRPLPENVRVLSDDQSGSLMAIIARESLRAYV